MWVLGRRTNAKILFQKMNYDIIILLLIKLWGTNRTFHIMLATHKPRARLVVESVKTSYDALSAWVGSGGNAGPGHCARPCRLA